MKITKEKADNIIAARKRGLSYKRLSEEFGISKWWCINNLRGIEIDKSWVEEQWRTAEKEAEEVLKKEGFYHILNLNLVCPNSPYWDYYAEKDNERWLFDVTINQSKNLVSKSLRAIDGFKMAVLIKDKDRWKLMEISVKPM